uniref:Reverse transcriptase domain-containing protein n=1 Tax=Fagus sylvatica TaxID=28930 RepID=A0A2N9HAJ1_FAGSY
MNEESAEILSATLGLVERVAGSDEDREGENCEQLRVIDNAINFGPTSNNSKENISAPFTLPTPINQPNMESFHPHAANSTRAMFGDITNVTPEFKPKISNGGAKWKRLAQAQSAPHSNLVAPLPLKHNNPNALVDGSSTNAWRLTGFYGAPETHRCEESWNLLRSLNNQSSLSWLCFGDFNEIVRRAELRGHRTRNENQMQGFRDVINDCGFIDLGHRGSEFTWCNNRKGLSTTWLRLDRAMANNDWLLRFNINIVHHLESSASDHKPLLVDCHPMPTQDQKHKLFRFEDVWHSNQGCEETINASWTSTPSFSSTSKMAKVEEKITRCRYELLKWSRPFTSVEVKDALNQMAPLKAPGSNGFSPIFYESYWHVVGQDVTEAVLSCLNSGTLLSSINHTFVTLIPKVKNPKKVIEYRPISLCNVVYKLILKVLANRLKLVLPHVISNTQSAFVPSHLITNNILVAFETLHHMHNQRGERTRSMALKLDMSKAYDKVESSFLQQVMIRMGFDPKWVSLIMECVSTVSYSLLINEGLNGLLTRAVNQGELHGVSICKRSPKLTHLFFADDNLFANFFPTGNILEAQGNPNGSYAWRSILRARDLIIAGSSWRVWDGTQINIKSENWLPESGHRQVLSPLSGLSPDTKVNTLMLGSHPRWNEVLIRQIFLLYDAEAILRIPLSTRAPEDKRYWHEAKNGKYSKRNQTQLNQPSDQYSQIWTQALSYLNEFLEATSKVSPVRPPPVEVKWKPPDQTWYKVNYDGALFQDSNESGIGVVIRDKHGNVIATLSQKISACPSVEMVEALATRRATSFALEIGTTDVEIEGDSTAIVQALRSPDTSHLAYGHVIDDATTLIYSQLSPYFVFAYSKKW